VQPPPDSFDPLKWYVGDIAEWDYYDVHWDVSDPVFHESLGFTTTRTIDVTTLPVELDSIVQITTLDVTYLEEVDWFNAVVEYDTALVEVELIECSHPDFVDEWSKGVEWSLPSDFDNQQEFWAKYLITRRSGVFGSLEIYPSSKVSSRTERFTSITGNIIGTPIDIGAVDVSTSNIINWGVFFDDAKSVVFRSHERVRAINVRINDWYSTITDPSYEQVYEDIVTSWGVVYSHGKWYCIGVSRSGIDSEWIRVQDRLKPNLQLEASVSDNPPPQGCGDIIYSYVLETGDVELYIPVLDKREGSVTVQWNYMGPDLDLVVHKTPPRVNRVSSKIQTDSSF